MRRAIYPGSFDPLTNGHLDIIERGCKLFDEIIIGILVNPAKQPFFTIEERQEMLTEVLADINKGKCTVRVDSFRGLLVNYAVAQQADYSQLRQQAEAQYAQGNYSRAHELYSKVDKLKLAAPDVRWVEFRLADTSWRAQAGTQTSDTTHYEEAQKQLEELIRVVEKETDRDLVWVEAHESLGDFFWTRRGQMNWLSVIWIGSAC